LLSGLRCIRISFSSPAIMRLFRSVILTTCLCAFLLLPATGREQQTPTNSKQASSSQAQPEPSITVADNHYSASEKEHNPAEESQRWPPPWSSPFWSNWAFVIVGLGAAIAAVWTLIAIRDQAEHTRKAADAALLSANTAINAERAWLLIEDITATPINFIRVPQFSFRVVNYGRTPAQVHGYRAYCQISASDQIPDDRSFKEGIGGRGDARIVPPHGEPLEISSTDMWPPFAIYPTQEEVEKIATNPPELYLWACGYVSYWDVFGKDAQEVKDLKITPFAMVYRASQAKLMRPTFPFLNRPT
jgi:hypothetical protein